MCGLLRKKMKNAHFTLGVKAKVELKSSILKWKLETKVNHTLRRILTFQLEDKTPWNLKYKLKT
jgi:hypothetical protein